MARNGNVRKRRDTGRYEVNWRDATGTRRWRTFDTRKAADRFLNKERAELDAIRAGVQPSLLQDKTWEDLVELWKIKKSAKRSLRDDLSRIRNHLEPVVGGMRLSDMGPSVVTRLEAIQRAKVEHNQLAASTSRKVLILYGSLMKLGVREQWVAQAPILELPTEIEHDYKWIHTADEMRALIAAAREEEYPGLPELYATALYTGLRSGELAALQWSDLDFANKLLTVSRSNDTVTKSGKVRRVPFSSALARMLMRWRPICHSPTLVFPNLAGTRMGKKARAKDEIYKRCLKRAKIPPMTFHA
ncbi:MAG: tyrosine-type recombinase/integrase, partial [Rhodobacterales bacterium]|nr:tyrosine-type recombinase/integrase [Rhodobacterales bacterium]